MEIPLKFGSSNDGREDVFQLFALAVWLKKNTCKSLCDKTLLLL